MTRRAPVSEGCYLRSVESPSSGFDVALLDLDGVLYRGPDPIEHAAAALERARLAGMGAYYVTNNASRTPQRVAAHLTQLGIPADPGQIITAAQAAAQLILRVMGSEVLVLPIGGEGLTVALQNAGLRLAGGAADEPDVVVQGFDKQLTWADLAEATYAIRNGARYVASNLDATIPTERGTTLGNGALVAAVVHATGATVLAAGKPEPEIFRQAQQRSGASTPLVVGDRLDTDLAGARAAGFAGLHVLTGVDGPAELLSAGPEERPTHLGLDLRALQESHPAVTIAPTGEVRCRAAVARTDADRVVLIRPEGELDLTDGGRITLDELRAACVAAWSASDRRQVRTILTTDVGPVTVSRD